MWYNVIIIIERLDCYNAHFYISFHLTAPTIPHNHLHSFEMQDQVDTWLLAVSYLQINKICLKQQFIYFVMSLGIQCIFVSATH